MVRTAVVAFAFALSFVLPASATDMRLVSLPPVDVEAEAEVGQTMVSVVRVETLPSIVTVEAYSKSGLTVPAGTYTYFSSDAVGTYYRGAQRLPHKTFGLSQPATTGGIFVPHFTKRPAEIYWDGDFGPVRYKVEGISFSPGPAQERTGSTSFKREMIYSGVSGGVVRISYREFSRDMARPAFTQELTYDLADGDEIGFRGARFRVLKATNVSIRYVVLKPLSGE